MVGFILTLLIALVISYTARQTTRYRLPGGMPITFIVGAIGAWAGYISYFSIGPSFEKLNIMPSIIGSMLLVFLFALFGKVFSNIKI